MTHRVKHKGKLDNIKFNKSINSYADKLSTPSGIEVDHYRLILDCLAGYILLNS